MPNKTIQFTLQAVPTAEQDVNLAITVDNVTVFNQAVASIGSAEPGVSDPVETYSFALDLTTSAVINDTETRSFAITSTNGSAKIENFLCNFAASAEKIGNVTQFMPGTADVFRGCDITSQPTWNGETDLSRYDISYNRGPNQITGPGEILVLAGETAQFDVAVFKYNDSAPS